MWYIMLEIYFLSFNIIEKEVLNMNKVLFYRCEKCGNIVALIKVGGGTLNCCGQEMTKLNANSTDAAKEKHVPVVIKDGDKIKVSVGSIEHPMLAEHFIEWIALVTNEKVEIVNLKPGMEPKAIFTYYNDEDEITGGEDAEVPNCEGQPCNFVYSEMNTEKLTVYEYCNLHGLWKTEL